MKKHPIYTMSFVRVYPLYIAKVERKGRKKKEVDEIIHWLTGYSQLQLKTHLKKQTDFETFFKIAPRMNPARKLITGVICGLRVEDIKKKHARNSIFRQIDRRTGKRKGYGKNSSMSFGKSAHFG